MGMQDWEMAHQLRMDLRAARQENARLRAALERLVGELHRRGRHAAGPYIAECQEWPCREYYRAALAEPPQSV